MVARTVARTALAEAQRHGSTDQSGDLAIITGRGKQSVDKEAVFRPPIIAMFQDNSEFRGQTGNLAIWGSSIGRWLALSTS